MIEATMIGEGRKTSSESRDTMMMRPAALSLGSTARSDNNWFPILPVLPSREKAVNIPMKIENCLEQSNGQ